MFAHFDLYAILAFTESWLKNYSVNLYVLSGCYEVKTVGYSFLALQIIKKKNPVCF